MRVLLAHNYYQQPGGEDRVFAAEASLMERRGHDVVRYCAHNDRVNEYSSVSLAAKTIWNRDSYTEFRSLLRRQRPDVCHFHNTFPLISPAAIRAAKAERIPVVLTLHNFRLLCPGATFLRAGAVCQECAGRQFPWPAILHACYRNSRAASATVGLMLFTHRIIGTWSHAIDRYIALTDLARQRFLEGGIAEEKIVVKPNFIEPDPGFSSQRGRHALFVARLSPEKGVDTLLEAWRLLEAPIPLRIAGDGPLAERVMQATRDDRRIQWLGHLSSDRVTSEMKKAYCLIVPSIWFEGGLPLTILEAFATGLPVVASKIGAMAELIEHQDTGLHFAAGDPAQLAERIRWCWDHPGELSGLGRRARARFERSYTAEANYRQLMSIYQSAGAAV